MGSERICVPLSAYEVSVARARGHRRAGHLFRNTQKEPSRKSSGKFSEILLYIKYKKYYRFSLHLGRFERHPDMFVAKKKKHTFEEIITFHWNRSGIYEIRFHYIDRDADHLFEFRGIRFSIVALSTIGFVSATHRRENRKIADIISGRKGKMPQRGDEGKRRGRSREVNAFVVH